MTPDVTQVGLAGILALVIIREVLNFLSKRKAETNGGSARVSLEPVLGRLDRIIDRLDDMADQTRDTRKQIQITAEQTARLCRAMSVLEDNIAKHWLAQGGHYHKAEA